MKFQWLTALILFCVFAFPAQSFARSEKAQGTIEDISVQDAAKLIKNKSGNVVIVDVRTPGEFKQGHIAGAQNIDLFGTRFEDQVAKLPPKAKILLYCRTGKRSAGAADLMKEAGLHVLHMKDGTEGWEKAKMPLTKD